jgi:hypothetical protein
MSDRRAPVPGLGARQPDGVEGGQSLDPILQPAQVWAGLALREVERLSNLAYTRDKGDFRLYGGPSQMCEPRCRT